MELHFFHRQTVPADALLPRLIIDEGIGAKQDSTREKLRMEVLGVMNGCFKFGRRKEETHLDVNREGKYLKRAYQRLIKTHSSFVIVDGRLFVPWLVTQPKVPLRR